MISVADNTGEKKLVDRYGLAASLREKNPEAVRLVTDANVVRKK